MSIPLQLKQLDGVHIKVACLLQVEALPIDTSDFGIHILYSRFMQLIRAARFAT
jgi:hypothetical protein